MPRLLSLWLPTLPTDRIRRREDIGAAPLVTVASVKGAQRLAAVDSAAAAASLRPGMALADARAICRPLIVRLADPAAEAGTLRAVTEWALRFTPVIALDPPDGLTLDVTGAAHLFGGETALRSNLVHDLGARGFQAQAAVADTAEAAWALAHHGGAGVAPSGPEALLHLAHPLPLAALRLDAGTLNALAQAGLRTIGDLLDRPRAPVVARFGAATLHRLDALLGWTRSPLVPIAPVPPVLAERRFAQPIATLEAVEASLRTLSHRLCTQLERAQTGARRVELTLFRVDGVVKRLTVGTSRPNREPAAIARLFHEKLESLGENGLDTGYGFDVMRLGAVVTEGLTADQVAFEAAADRAAEADLAALVDRLGARLGVARVLQLHDADRHIPEHAAVAWPAQREAIRPMRALEPADLQRPLRLLDHPEPIDTVAEVPDGPPVLFRWRRAEHRLTAVEGPERIAAPWWTTAALTRDYFEAEDGNGRRYWLFREGLYGREVERPSWFLHGLFG